MSHFPVVIVIKILTLTSNWNFQNFPASTHQSKKKSQKIIIIWNQRSERS
jgi:hypothetical protein